MSGWLLPGMPLLTKFTGQELFYADTQNTQGIVPESGGISPTVMAAALLYFGNFASKTTVAGTRYFSSINSGVSMTVTGIAVLIGSTGGTDNWLVELHDSTGALVATSATAGVTAGTAGSWQQIAFTAAVTVPAGTYFIVVQSNGTTAKPAVYNFPAPSAAPYPLLTGSSTGTFGTSAAITPPTTYTANVGPVALPY